MSTNTFLRRGLPMIVLLVVSLSLAGCGDYYDDDYYGGTLQVTNDPSSFEVIEFVNLWVPGGPIESYAFFLMPGETDFIDLYPDSYTVELEWSDALVETFDFVDVFDHATTLIVGVN